MQAAAPEEVRGGPSQIGVELVVQRPSKEQADDIGSQDGSQNEVGTKVLAQRSPVLAFPFAAKSRPQNVWDGLAGSWQPPREDECEEN